MNDRFCYFGLIHRIDMNVPYVIRNQIDDLFACVDDARLTHRIGIGTETVHDRPESLRYICPGHLNSTGELSGGRNRHDTGNDRNLNACIFRPVKEIVEDIVIEEHLCRQKVTARIDFLFQMRNVISLVFTLDMPLGITSSSDTEISGFFYLSDQFGGILIIMLDPAILRNISAQRENIKEPSPCIRAAPPPPCCVLN